MEDVGRYVKDVCRPYVEQGGPYVKDVGGPTICGGYVLFLFCFVSLI